MSRLKAEVSGSKLSNQGGKEKSKDVLPTLEGLLANRDYTGAITLLKFQKSTGTADVGTGLWLAYAAFHNGDYETARKVRIIITHE